MPSAIARSGDSTEIISSRRRNALAEITARMPGLSCQGSLGQFLDRYFVAESLATRLQNYYRADTGQRDADKIQISQLVAAHHRFSLHFTDDQARELFLGGSGKQGTKSARQLRNGYVHSLSSADRFEIESRSLVLVADLDAYIASCGQL